MKGLKSWAKVHEVIEGFAASLKDTPFVTSESIWVARARSV